MATLAARDFLFPVLRLGFEPNTTRYIGAALPLAYRRIFCLPPPTERDALFCMTRRVGTGWGPAGRDLPSRRWERFFG